MSMDTVDDVLAGLDEVVERSIHEGDVCGYFAVVYRKVTAKIKEGLAAGFFDDPERMERLDVLFAARYLDAVAAHRVGGRPTDSWALTFDAGDRWRPLVLQHLLVGINAHINLDLGIAAARCAPGSQLAGLRRDFDRVNAVLAAMITTLEADLRAVSPWMGLLDHIGGRSRTELVRFSIVAARAGAWQFATELAEEPTSRWSVPIEERDRRVAAVGRRVLRPGAWMSAGLLLVRLRERSDVAANLKLLRDGAEPSFEVIEAAIEGPTLKP